MATALLIIDMQEDFLPPDGSLAVAGGRDLINPIINLLKSRKWDAIIATKDWHPQNHISFAQSKDDLYTTIDVKSPYGTDEIKTQTLWPVHCIQNSEGAKYPKDLEDAITDAKENGTPTLMVHKGTETGKESYSCFRDIWDKGDTECESFLREHNISKVIVVGLALDFCVFHSSVDSKQCGFKTVVYTDLSKPVNSDTTEIMEKYKDNGIELETWDGK